MVSSHYAQPDRACVLFCSLFCLTRHRLGKLSFLLVLSVFNVTDKEGKKIKDEETLAQIEDYIRKV